MGVGTRFIMTTTASESRYPTRDSLFECYDLTLTSFSESYQLINKMFYYFFREIVEFEGSLMDLSILSKRLHNILKESSASISIMPGKCCILDT
jgi:hypothetical protein